MNFNKALTPQSKATSYIIFCIHRHNYSYHLNNSNSDGTEIVSLDTTIKPLKSSV